MLKWTPLESLDASLKSCDLGVTFALSPSPRLHLLNLRGSSDMTPAWESANGGVSLI
jgi:hypothetical protein